MFYCTMPTLDNQLKASNMALSWIEREMNRYGQEYSVHNTLS